MTQEHSYIFSDEEKARMFENAADHLGYAAHRIGNAVIAEAGAFEAVTDNYTVYEEQAPVWTSDPALRLPANYAVTCKG